MENKSRAQTAAIVGMVGAGLWMISVIMQNVFGLFGPGSGPLYPIHQLLAFAALGCIIVGFLGLVWGDAVQSRFGRTAVYLHMLSWALIIFTGLVALLIQTEDSPIFLLYPLAGILSDLSGLLIGIAALIAKNWSGWQRYMPLVYFLVVFFGVNLPSFLGVTDGPGMIGEFIMGACWFGLSLAVYTARPGKTAVRLSTT